VGSKVNLVLVERGIAGAGVLELDIGGDSERDRERESVPEFTYLYIICIFQQLHVQCVFCFNTVHEVEEYSSGFSLFLEI
jgi:hypothetical protein